MNRLSTQRRAQVIGCPVEGNSIRAAVRMTGAAKNTISKLLLDLDEACSAYQDRTLRNLPYERVQVDEKWAFVGAKQKNVKPEHNSDWGDAWTFVAIEADSKLVQSWWVGQRTVDDADAALCDLRDRASHRVKLTTDGHSMYLTTLPDTFAGNIDHAMLIKEYGNAPADGPNTHYSPAPCTGIKVKKITGVPDLGHQPLRGSPESVPTLIGLILPWSRFFAAAM